MKFKQYVTRTVKTAIFLLVYALRCAMLPTDLCHHAH